MEKTMPETISFLREIDDIATGEDQCALDDSEGMGVIHDRITEFLED